LIKKRRRCLAVKVTNIDWEPGGCQAKVSLENERSFHLSREGVDQCRLTKGAEVVLEYDDFPDIYVIYKGMGIAVLDPA